MNTIIRNTKTCKVKVKLPCALAEHDSMKEYLGSGGIATRILDLGTKWR